MNDMEKNLLVKKSPAGEPVEGAARPNDMPERLRQKMAEDFELARKLSEGVDRQKRQ